MGGSRKLFFGAVLGALINTLLVIANALLIATILVSVINQKEGALSKILLLAALWVVRSLFNASFDRWASVEASRLKAHLRNKVFHSSELLISTPSTHLSTLLLKGANSLDIYLARFLPQMFSAVATPLSVIAAIAVLDPISAITALLTIPLIPIFGALIGRYTQDAVNAKWQSLGTLGKYFEDSLRGLHTLSIFGRVSSQRERITTMGDKYTAETMKVLRISFLSALVLELAATISVALIAVSIGIRLVNGSMDFWPALAILILAPEVYFPLRNAASLFHASADGGAALAEISSLIAIFEGEAPEGDEDISKIEEVSWSHWDSPFSTGSIEPCSLSRGDSLVIRGGSGLGKTTFFNSLLSFRRSDEFTINRSALEGFDPVQLRSQIGWIPQSPTLVEGTVRELFQLLRTDASDHEITSVLESVGLSMTALANGLDTRIAGMGEKGGHLSGGQVRRIAIARALFINPSLILADEPTADLDPQSAREILGVLDQAAARGVIVIAILHAPDQGLANAHEIVMAQ